MRVGWVVWVGEVACAVRVPGEGAAIHVPAAAGRWWIEEAGPVRLAEVVRRLAGPGPDDRVGSLTLLAPDGVRPGLGGALSALLPGVDVEVVPVQTAVSEVLGTPARVAEWRDGGLLWSGAQGRPVALAPRTAWSAARRAEVAAEGIGEQDVEGLLRAYADRHAPPDATPPAAARHAGPARRRRTGALAGAGAVAVVAVVVAFAVSTSGAGPSASPPASAGPGGSAASDPTAGGPTASGPTASGPTSSGAASSEPTGPAAEPPPSDVAGAIVAAFFSALDVDDVEAAASLLCADLRASLGDELAGLTAYSWGRPRIESDVVEGAGRVLVVAVPATARGRASTERLRVTVTRTLRTEICGFAPA